MLPLTGPKPGTVFVVEEGALAGISLFGVTPKRKTCAGGAIYWHTRKYVL